MADGQSSCCGEPVYDPGGTGEGICTGCKEHCTTLESKHIKHKPRAGLVYNSLPSILQEMLKEKHQKERPEQYFLFFLSDVLDVQEFLKNQSFYLDFDKKND